MDFFGFWIRNGAYPHSPCTDTSKKRAITNTDCERVAETQEVVGLLPCATRLLLCAGDCFRVHGDCYRVHSIGYRVHVHTVTDMHMVTDMHRPVGALTVM